MKNLAVRARSGRSLKSLKDEILSDLEKSSVLYAINPNNDDFYLWIKNTLYKIPTENEEGITSFQVDQRLQLVGLEYCNISQKLYAATESGDIVRINLDFEIECETVCHLGVKLQCMKLSPDHEVIILITVDGIVLTMVSTFQVVSEINLHSTAFGRKQFVTVGWGKKETQFHGSEGKKAATAKPIEINKNDTDDGLYRITWREDGSLFAVGFLHYESKTRQFKVFNREGILQYTSELINGLEESLSWKPSGNLLATTQSLVNKHIVALFEKNGLKHREFSLPFEPKEVIVKDLSWSPDSEILAIWCKKRKDDTSVLQLWMENNYHWYLKQTITFSAKDPLIYVTWSTVSRFKKLILLTSQEILEFNYNWCVDHSRGENINDKAVVGVIDGHKSLMTGLRMGIVPPPMAHQAIELSESINAIVFAPNVENKNSWVDSNAFFCVSNSNNLTFYKHITDSSTLEYEFVGSYTIEWNTPVIDPKNLSYKLHHFLWFKEDIILCSASLNNENYLCVLTMHQINAQNQGQIIVHKIHDVDGSIEHLVPSPDSEEIYLIIEYSIFKYTMETELRPTDVELQDCACKVDVAKIGSKQVILSLSHRNCFSIDGKQMANNITSFYVHSEFLLLTTLQHTLICVSLNEQGFEELIKYDLTVKPWESNLKENCFADMNLRRIERGSSLIVAIPKDSKTILQMPRGNLECIQPRSLSLFIIGYYLNNYQYLAAFDLMRRQRINLNLIYDHDPQRFVENAEKFVEEISKPSWISLFLSELQNEDVTATIYKNYYWKNSKKLPFTSVNKVEFVCQLLRDIMERRTGTNALIQPILISLVKSKKEQGLEAALIKIKEIQKLEESTNSITSNDALKYLLYLVDVNVLFDVALSMYDFELTMFIGSKSQKDPKEYIPFLNDLKKLDENYMKYSIDLHLKRYESALKHIAQERSRLDECINLIRTHNLYRQALNLFDKGTTEYKEVVRIYGEFLSKKMKYQEAGIMFYRSGDLEEALNAYKLAGSWQDAIIISTQMNLSSTEKHTLYSELVQRLKTDKKYQEAASVLIDYLKDIEEAIIVLCYGKHWKIAVRIAYDYQRLDLIKTRIKPSLYEYADHVISHSIQKNRQEFEKHMSRLSIVRSNIAKKSAESHNGTNCDDELTRNRSVSDILSDTTSNTGSTSSQKSRSSVLSGKSYRSSKNRRKHERKLTSLKEGSVFEDVALIQALHQIISNAYREKDDLKALIEMLVHFNSDEHAEKVQNYAEEFFRLIERSRSEIWDESAPSSLTELEKSENSLSVESQGTFMPQKLIEPYITCAPETSTTPWKLDIF